MDGAMPGVLLVEDDAATRGMIARHLRGNGYAVTAAESAEQVIFDVDREGARFEIVISDVHLPGTSGIDLASYLLVKNPSQAIVLITGDPDEALARDALSRGPVSYLLKPFELFELDAALRQVVARLAASREEHPGHRRVDVEPGNPGIPEEWVRFVDDRSYAGPGHAERVANLAALILQAMTDVAPELSPSELSIAARMHELGRLGVQTGDPPAMAGESGRLLEEAGFPAPIVLAVRHLHERWDGTGGPDGLSASAIPRGAQVLSVADSLDHYCAAWLQAGVRASEAVDRALSLVGAQEGGAFSPLVVGAMHRERAAIRMALATREEGESRVA